MIVEDRCALVPSNIPKTVGFTRGRAFGGVSAAEAANSESPEELLEEGQTFEAGRVENAPAPDQGEVRTHEVPQDDVPEKYDVKATFHVQIACTQA